MAGPGLYYPPPPVFVGGRQPYAPAQPLVTSTVTEIPASPTLQSRQIQSQILAAWAPKPLIIVWSGPAGAMEVAPDPPVPLPATSLGLAHLFPVLAQWQPGPIPLRVLLPRAPLPALPLAITPPYFSTGRVQFAIVLQAWEPPPLHLVRIEPVGPPPEPPVLGGGRLVGPNRLVRV